MTASEFCPQPLPLPEFGLESDHSLDIWLLDFNVLDAPFAVDEDDARSAGSRRTTPRALRMAGQFYLRLLLGRYLGLPGLHVKLVRNTHGKPSLAGEQKLYFNLSNHARQALIAFSATGPVGIDLEGPRQLRDPLRIARRFFSPEEYQQLAAHPGDLRQAFLRFWVYKEAIAKAYGRGIANTFKTFSVDGLDNEQCAASLPDGSQWQARAVGGVPDGIAAVATQSATGTIRKFQLLSAA